MIYDWLRTSIFCICYFISILSNWFLLHNLSNLVFSHWRADCVRKGFIFDRNLIVILLFVCIESLFICIRLLFFCMTKLINLSWGIHHHFLLGNNLINLRHWRTDTELVFWLKLMNILWRKNRLKPWKILIHWRIHWWIHWWM